MYRTTSSNLKPCRQCLVAWWQASPWVCGGRALSFIGLRSSVISRPDQNYTPPSHNAVSLKQFVRFSRQACNLLKNESNHRQIDQEWTLPTGSKTGIKVYNSLTKRKEFLVLPNGNLATWYSCGPTVYDKAHIGHASTYIRLDIIRRILKEHFNIDCIMVMGVTDIDDKIIKKALEMKVDFKELTWKYESEFVKDMSDLNVLPPTVKTRVTEYVPHIISFIENIMANGYAYTTPSGSVYFDIQKYTRYGRWGGDSEDSGERNGVEQMDKEKKSNRDFALWKAAKEGEPWWQSPWGQGRPGWHIECSAMASAIFGKNLDIHTGGDDLRFPHHENEIAQSEACFCSHQWANYWLHTGHLHQKNQPKMSKSLKNTIWITDLLQHYTASQFRMFCMLRSYRHPIEYSDESMFKAVQILRRWLTFLDTAEAYISGQLTRRVINEAQLMQKLEETKERLHTVLADDFDTPKAISAMEDLIHAANKELKGGSGASVTPMPYISRSPAVIAAVSNFVKRHMDIWGLHTRQRASMQSEADMRLQHVLASVVKFRTQVRTFGMTEVQLPKAGKDDSGNEKERRKAQRQVMSPLFTACDELRENLQAVGLQVQDHGAQSSITIQKGKKVENN